MHVDVGEGPASDREVLDNGFKPGVDELSANNVVVASVVKSAEEKPIDSEVGSETTKEDLIDSEVGSLTAPEGATDSEIGSEDLEGVKDVGEPSMAVASDLYLSLPLVRVAEVPISSIWK